MILSLISVTLIVLSSLGIARIIGRHSRVLASIDVDSIPAERYAAVKDALIVNRIKRRLSSGVQLLSIILQPVIALFKSLRENIYGIQSILLRVRE